mmetsp:Transcript_53023/g.113237  ORF Transcript_53023/g.113237 Transcript_53023/m.113237 type:complete len:239 (-) Transcript_53023:500-1216(-)
MQKPRSINGKISGTTMATLRRPDMIIMATPAGGSCEVRTTTSTIITSTSTSTTRNFVVTGTLLMPSRKRVTEEVQRRPRHTITTSTATARNMSILTQQCLTSRLGTSSSLPPQQLQQELAVPQLAPAASSNNSNNSSNSSTLHRKLRKSSICQSTWMAMEVGRLTPTPTSTTGKVHPPRVAGSARFGKPTRPPMSTSMATEERHSTPTQCSTLGNLKLQENMFGHPPRQLSGCLLLAT